MKKIKREAETMIDYKTRANLRMPLLTVKDAIDYFHFHSEINLLIIGTGSQVDVDNKINPW